MPDEPADLAALDIPAMAQALIDSHADGSPIEPVAVAQAFIDLAASVPDLERAARRAERARLAEWFTTNAETITSFSPDGLTVELVAFLLSIDHE